MTRQWRDDRDKLDASASQMTPSIARNQEEIWRGKEGSFPGAFTENMTLPADTLISDF